MNWTWPSTKRKLPPPGWRLRKPNWPISRFFGSDFQLTGLDWGLSGIRKGALSRGTVVASPWGRVSPAVVGDWIARAAFQTLKIVSGSLGNRANSPIMSVLLWPSQDWLR